MSEPVLVVQHEAACPPDLVGEWLTEAGILLEIRRPYDGDELPSGVDGFAGLVVLGGHMGANDDATVPWLSQTKELIRQGAAAGMPVLGICLGHQLAAVALGGQVVVNPAGPRRGVSAMGWLPTAADDPVLGGVVRGGEEQGLMWHHDVVVRVPDRTVELARASTGELLAARFAPTVRGVQNHPEAGSRVVSQWADRDKAEASDDAEWAAADEGLAEALLASDALADGWRPLASGFAALCR